MKLIWRQPTRTGATSTATPATEYLKIVAFVEKPAAFDRWIETSGGKKAQARLKVVTRASGS